MRALYLRGFLTALSFSLLLLGGLNQDSFAQGKGGGKGGGGGRPDGPPGQQQRGGPPQQRQQPQPQMRQMPQPQARQMPQMRPQPQPQMRQMPQMRQQPVFRQPAPQQAYRQSPGQMRQQERQVFQQRGPVWRQQQPQIVRQQPQIYRQQAPQRIFRENPGQMRKQQQQQVRQAYTPPVPVYQERGNRGQGRIKQEQRVYSAPEQRQYPLTPGWVPPGQIRSAEVHERNAIRQAAKEQERIYRQGQVYQQPYYQPYSPAPVYTYPQQYYSYDPYSYSTVVPYIQPAYVDPYVYTGGGYLSYSPLYVPNAIAYAPYSTYSYYPDYYSYGSPYYGYYDDNRFDWKSMLVRSIIGFALGAFTDNDYVNNPFAYNPYNSSGYGYGYPSSMYSTASYSPYGGYYPSFIEEPVYIQPVYDIGGYQEPLVNLLPVQDLFGPTYGGYSGATLREVLAQGYEQGYQAGWYARENQLRDNYYSSYLDSGYAYDDDYYDPYAYSIGENRRCFSEGYALGYQDALNSRENYLVGYGRDTDLLSLLLSNVIGVV